MKSAVILLAFLGPLPAAAQCTAFLVPPAARLTIDEYGNNVWRKERADYVVAYPARAFTAKEPVMLQASAFDFTQASCSRDGFVVNKKSDLIKFWVKKGADLEAVWANPDAFVEVSYSPASGSNGSAAARARWGIENLAAIDRAATLVLDRIKGADFKPPEIENQRTIAAPFDKVWAALVETLSDQKWQIESIDKGSGLVTTKAAIDSSGATMACATKLDEAHRTWLNVFVKATDGGTRVKVNATFKAMRDDQAITCYSSGTIEKSLFEGISKNL